MARAARPAPALEQLTKEETRRLTFWDWSMNESFMLFGERRQLRLTGTKREVFWGGFVSPQ